MLLSKPVTVGETVSIKLVTGEEIIARLEEETTEYVKLSKPKTVSIGPQGLGMMPFMFLGGADSVKIKQNHILVMVISAKDASDQYIQGTTGIALT